MADDHEILQGMVEKAKKLLEQAARIQVQANQWAEMIGVELPFSSIATPDAGYGASLRPDSFRGNTTPGAAARAFLALRGKARGAATLDEIFDGLRRGGYSFSGADREAKSSLKIALGRDTQIDKLANGHYGLLEWYGGTKRDRGRQSEQQEAPMESAGGDSAELLRLPGDEKEDSKKRSPSAK